MSASRPSSLRIVVTGFAATYPFGGVFWDYIRYVLGFHQLGHDVLYLEDTGRWCYSPVQQTFVESGRDNAEHLAKHLTQLEPALRDRWFYRDATGACFGRPWPEVVQFCRDADLFLHVSASCRMRDEYFAARTVAFLDSDPMYTQSSVPNGLDGSASAQERERLAMLQRHDAFFTFGLNMGRSDCRVPSELFDWKPTVQPVVLSCFDSAQVPVGDRRRVLTTVASWEPTEKGPTVRGVSYAGKSVEFGRFMDLPSRSPLPLELALSGPAPRDRLVGAGWQVREAYEVSHDPWVYRDYLARSFAEWSVAKNAYAAGRNRLVFHPHRVLPGPWGAGDRAGDGVRARPAHREGLLTFNTPDEAVAAIEQVVADPERHARAAEAIAREHFAADRVLSRLLEEVADVAPSH